MTSADPVASAYAVLGLTPGCTPRELKQAYRQLVKRWHPDRHTADPIGQAEATVRLRQINQAFRVVAEALAPSPRAPTRAASNSPADVPPPAYDSGRPLSRQQIDDMVRTLQQDGPVDLILGGFGVAVPFALAFLLLIEPRRWASVTMLEKLVGLTCFCFGVVQLARRKAASKREGIQ